MQYSTVQHNTLLDKYMREPEPWFGIEFCHCLFCLLLSVCTLASPRLFVCNFFLLYFTSCPISALSIILILSLPPFPLFPCLSISLPLTHPRLCEVPFINGAFGQQDARSKFEDAARYTYLIKILWVLLTSSLITCHATIIKVTSVWFLYLSFCVSPLHFIFRTLIYFRF